MLHTYIKRSYMGSRDPCDAGMFLFFRFTDYIDDYPELSQVVEFLFAAATASRVAYNTYIYTKVPTDRFQIVTAYTKAALLAGRCLAGIIGQVLITTGTCDYFELNYLSLGFVTLAALISLFLPGVDHSIYFRDSEQHQNPNKDETCCSNEK